MDQRMIGSYEHHFNECDSSEEILRESTELEPWSQLRTHVSTDGCADQLHIIVLPGGRNECFRLRLKIVEGSGWSCYQYYVIIMADLALSEMQTYLVFSILCCFSSKGVVVGRAGGF